MEEQLELDGVAEFSMGGFLATSGGFASAVSCGSAVSSASSFSSFVS
ncbi:thiocillin family RiPP [Enterococcus sp. AZ194]